MVSQKRPPTFEKYSWADVILEAKGKTIKFWMWSGNNNINNWVDNWLAPQMLTHFGITLIRVPQ